MIGCYAHRLNNAVLYVLGWLGNKKKKAWEGLADLKRVINQVRAVIKILKTREGIDRLR